MDIYLNNKRWKLYFLIIAALIILGSLYYTNQLAQKLKIEEKKRVAVWAEGLKSLHSNPDQDVSLINFILEQNETIPVILVDNQENIVDFRNIDIKGEENEYLSKLVSKMKSKNKIIKINLDSGNNYIYFDDSKLLVQLAWYPYIQMGLIIIFSLVAYVVFSYFKSAEQNRIWVGMSKETAHQLGTPISSLMAWNEILKSKYGEESMYNEIEKDITRLQTITQRFSNIGSQPKLKNVNIKQLLQNNIKYLKTRTSKRVNLVFENKISNGVSVMINEELFSWVVENLWKNAIDAMHGQGELNITAFTKQDNLVIDIKDSGKGILKSKFKTIFKPGVTSKKRGWGLGLSLAKRIVEEYHKGSIYVLNSEINKGTCFRIELSLSKQINSAETINNNLISSIISIF
ncbi:MAG: HAMP domain-containing histidine kinase [Marinifilaceae bacterium]|nr:HAMP domain-containing histidine kinase [Marinifilaceae bacterium]